MKSVEEDLQMVVEELERSAQKICATQGYTHEVGQIRLLEEIIREQMENEDSRRSVGSIR